MQKSKIYHNVFTESEIEQILNYFAKRPIASVNATTGNLDKNVDYHIPYSIAHRLIKPKIQNLFGDHSFQNGSYKECVSPYPTHIDNYAWWADKAYTFDVEIRHQCFILIPLVFGKEFRTVLFDILSPYRLEIGEAVPTHWLSKYENNLNLDDFGHCKEEVKQQIKYLPVNQDITWQLGDIFYWHRNQLHCSTNFAQYGVTKKFVILGIA